jgi:hypothetical protein
MSILIPIIIGIIFIKRLPQPVKVFYLYLIAYAFIKLPFILMHRHAIFLDITWPLFELFFFGYVFKSFFGNAKLPKIILDLGLLTILAIIITQISLNRGWFLNDTNRFVESITLVSLSLCYFITSIVYRISKNEEIGQGYLTWFSLATIVYFILDILFNQYVTNIFGEIDFVLIITVIRFSSYFLLSVFLFTAKLTKSSTDAHYAKFLSGPFTRWPVLINGMKFSSEEFYDLIEQKIKARIVPDIKFKRVQFRTGGMFSDKRIYLRISRKGLTYDVCAAPFGEQFFVSSWFGSKSSFLFELPLIGKLLEWWLAPKTYYQHDSNSMFIETVKQCIQTSLDEIMNQQGIRLISDEQRKSIQINRL